MAQRSIMISYYKTILDKHEPKTLTEEIQKSALANYSAYYKVYSIRKARVEKIDHIVNDMIVETFAYTYKENQIDSLIWLRLHHEISVKCIITVDKGGRHSRCYYKSGILYTEEWYNTKTSEYQFTRYDETGKPEYSEHGSFAPPKDT